MRRRWRPAKRGPTPHVAPIGAAHKRCAATQLVQEEHGLCHSLPSTHTIAHRFAFISVQTTSNFVSWRKNGRFPLAFRCSRWISGRRSRGPAVRRAWTVQRARRAPWVRVYLFTYVYIVAVNKGASNLCKTPVNLSRSKRCRRHNPCAACVGTRGCVV